MIQEIYSLVEKQTGKKVKTYYVGDNDNFLTDVIRDAFNDTRVYFLEASALVPFPNSEYKHYDSFKLFGKTFNIEKNVIGVKSNQVMHPIKDEDGQLIGDYIGNCIGSFLFYSFDSTEFSRHLILYFLYKAKILTKNEVNKIFKDYEKPIAVENFVDYLNNRKSLRIKTLERAIDENKARISLYKSDIEKINTRIVDDKQSCEKLKTLNSYTKKMIEEDLKKVRKLDFVKNIDITRDAININIGKLKIRSTHSKVKRTLYTTKGEYVVSIVFPKTKDDYWYYRVQNNILKLGGHNQHPHVSSSGETCQGRFSPHDFINDGKISVMLQCLYELLSGYNSNSPYVKIGVFKKYETYVYEKTKSKLPLEKSLGDFIDEDDSNDDDDDDDDDNFYLPDDIDEDDEDE